MYIHPISKKYKSVTGNKKIKAVVFDIDGTLSPDISWTKITDLLGSSVPDHKKIYGDFKSGRASYEESVRIVLKLWRGEGDLHKSRLEKMFREWNLKNDTVPLFRYLKKKGYLICLITGSVDLFAQVIAEMVGADAWYANSTLTWDNKGNLADLVYEPLAGEKKLKQFLEFCSRNSLEVEECVMVGDDMNDTELFKATRRGILVESPSSSVLENVAWKKVKTLTEIENIL
ncbi:MAG: HAD-IB family phosphatase [Candidatus Jorgensenbacteria bacterium]